MDCNCNCFGIAASSRKPVKRYNLLVPEIFPKQSPPLQEKIDVSTERKVKKLFEYVEKNPNRAPKISRRLARRVEKGLSAGQPGFVQIAVAAYIYLLDHLKENGSSLFAKEVICQQVAKPTHFYENLLPSVECFTPRADSGIGSDLGSTNQSSANAIPSTPTASPDLSVTGILLSSGKPEMQVLGSKLLAAFIKQQVTAEYLAYVEMLVDRLLNLQSSKIGDSALRTSVLTAQQEYVNFCSRVSSSCRLMHPLLEQLLPLWADNQTPKDVKTERDVGNPSEAALVQQLLQTLGQQAQGTPQGKGFCEAIMQHLDARDSWSADGSPSHAPALQLLKEACTDEQQQYKAYSALVHHAAVSKLPAMQRLSIAATACQEGQALPTVLSSAALILAVREFLPWIGECEGQSNGEIGQREVGVEGQTDTAVRDRLLGLIRQLAAALGDQQHLLEALAGIMIKQGHPAGYSPPVLECLTAAASALTGYTDKASSVNSCMLPPSLLQELTILAQQGSAEQSLFAHEMFRNILTFTPISVTPAQIRVILSLVWHQVAVRRTPEDFVAISLTLAALLKASPPQNLPEFSLLGSELRQRVLTGGNGHLESVSSSQQLATLLLAEFIHVCLATASAAPPYQPLLQQTSQLKLTETGLQEIGAKSGFEEASDAEALQVLESLRSQDNSLPGKVAVEGQDNNTLTAEAYFIPLMDLTQRSRSHAASWFGNSHPHHRTTDPEGRPAGGSGPAHVKLRIRSRHRPRAGPEGEAAMLALLQEIGLLPEPEVPASSSAVTVSFEERTPTPASLPTAASEQRPGGEPRPVVEEGVSERQPDAVNIDDTLSKQELKLAPAVERSKIKQGQQGFVVGQQNGTARDTPLSRVPGTKDASTGFASLRRVPYDLQPEIAGHPNGNGT